jgi:hypothetical protein
MPCLSATSDVSSGLASSTSSARSADSTGIDSATSGIVSAARYAGSTTCTRKSPPRSDINGFGERATGTLCASITRSSPRDIDSVRSPSGVAAAARASPPTRRFRSARPFSQYRNSNDRTSGTSSEITSPRASSSSRSVWRGNRYVCAGM